MNGLPARLLLPDCHQVNADHPLAPRTDQGGTEPSGLVALTLGETSPAAELIFSGP